MHTEPTPAQGADERVDGASIPVFADAQPALLSARDVLSRKWNPVLLYHLLAGGPMGFSALKERIDDISSKMLSESLDDLESAGLVSRAVVSDQPVRVEYRLTAHGEALEPALAALIEWAATGTRDGEATGGSETDDHEDQDPEGTRSGQPAEGA